MKVVVIGGVAAGPKTASRVMRLAPDTDLTLVERGRFLSFAGCGLPYYIADWVRESKELMCTPVGVIRDVSYFRHVKDFHVRDRTEALEIDRERRRVRVCSVDNHETQEWLPYDRLVLCTGAKAIVPPIPGVNKSGVHVLHSIEDADQIRAVFDKLTCPNVVIVGGGLIGLEMAESVVARGGTVTVVEMQDHVLGMLDVEMARLVERHMRSHGARVLTNTTLQEIVGDRQVRGVVTSQGEFAADMVILSVGVRPNSELARAAGLAIGPLGGIVVDEQMRTSDPHIMAAGDCVEVKHLITGRSTYVPLGSTANKQGRVAAATVTGREDRFPGVLGSAVCRVFDFTVARAGLTQRQAEAAHFDVITAVVPAPDKPHFIPDARAIFMKVVADRATRRLLGIQCVGPGDGDKRSDVAATAITARMTVDDLAQVDLCYSPPFSPAMDNIITAANVLRNKLDGMFEGRSAQDIADQIERGDPCTLLDVRSPEEYRAGHIPGSLLIPLDSLRQRVAEVPRDRPVIVFCKVSLRGYEAALILNQAGIQQVAVMEGGLALWPGKLVAAA